MNREKIKLCIALIDAVVEGNPLEVEKLLKAGADINFSNLFEESKTPLHYAVASGNINIVKILLERGANKEAKCEDRKTPIDFCSLLDDETRRAIETAIGKHAHAQKPNVSEQKLSIESDSTVQTYTKRPGTAAVGQFYETKLLTMVLFRLLHDQEIDHFYLGNNLDEAGAFDDVVLRTCVGGKSQVICLQAKHKNFLSEFKSQNF
ncbi:conserved hypothetical protein [Culex quinquefasciatus]|uniref:Uncharacterized protein n=1 Tax=Culex quinquefasciatus TaxID=7176 RepID=B0WSV4_CULQU|nr:conserved hypothetical protein [Culex quinquefasciatus]|eukprot:XP_001870721.1 conserved hypothetical protein [Culex quinquefasciatus]